MNKEELRNKLFERYFECKDGILITDLMETVKPIVEVYEKLKRFLIQHKTLKLFSNIERVKLLSHNGKDYLFLKKASPYSYLIVDIVGNRVLSEEEISCIFEENLFVENFEEPSVELDDDWLEWYHFLRYEGDVKELVDFYNQNKNILDIPTRVFNKLDVGEAWTWLSISLCTGQIQLSFQTEDQFLYEVLFLNSDLTPFGLQDATEKIGKEKMLEMFDRIKEIKIPKEIIPSQLLDVFFKSFTLENEATQKVKQKKVSDS